MERFSDYLNKHSNEHSNNKKEQEEKGNEYNNTSKNRYSEEDLYNMIEKYSTYSSNELMREFLKLTLEKKKNGELDNKAIVTLKETLTPMLNEEQKDNLNKILEMVENVK